MNAYTYFEFIAAFEYLMIKFMSVVIFKRVAPILDDFFAVFLFLLNLSLSLFFSLINCHTVGNHQAQMRIQGLPLDLADFSLFQFE